MKVYKFGGASIKNAECVKNVAQIIQEHSQNEQLVVVVSASGKMTDALERLTNAYYKQTDDVLEIFDSIKQFHIDLATELIPDESHSIFEDLNEVFVEIEWVLEEEPVESYDYLYDQIVPNGEFMSTKIVAAYLNHLNLNCHWLDVRDVILTDNTYREAKVDWDKTVKNAQRVIPKLLDNNIVLTQGFVGGTSENFTSTLGREGSDFTGAILTYALDAESLSIWKDVKGVLNADPRKFEKTIKIDELSYKEAIEMTYYGAQVIHPKTIKPLQNKQIPLFVKCFEDASLIGTKISDAQQVELPSVIVLKENQILFSISTKDFSFISEQHLAHIFTQLSTLNIKVNMMQNTAISFSICVDHHLAKISQLQTILADFKTEIHENVSVLTIRHYKEDLVNELRAGKTVLLEERIRNTVQLVMKD